MNKDNLFLRSEIKNQIEGIEKNRPSEVDKDGIYLFISFDLMNATEYKTRNYDRWFETFLSFYKYVAEKIQGADSDSPIKKAKVWKYIGDEVLFYLRVTNKDELFNCPEFLLEVISDTEKSLKEESMYFDKIYIKATAWIADVVDEKNLQSQEDKNKFNNVVFHPDKFRGEEIDFLGSDIDLGFRISKYSHKNTLTIDAKLAYLLQKFKKSVQYNLKIIEYQTLKGIWRGHKYPIIWYCQDWEDIFLYDENIRDEVKSALDNKKKFKISVLQKIFNHINQEKNIEELCEKIKKLTDDNNLLKLADNHNQHK